jgi:F-type H+-transporting ATPase subunit b
MSAFDSILAVAASAAAETKEHGGEPAAEHGSAVFPPLDASTFSSQLFWLAVTFGLLLFLLSKVFLPRLGGILEHRSNQIADDLDSAARMQREAEHAERSYEQALSDARAKAHNVAETTRASINTEIESEMQKADEETARQMNVAESKIRDLRAKALSNVDDIAADTAKTLVESLFSGKITAATATKAVKAQG